MHQLRSEERMKPQQKGGCNQAQTAHEHFSNRERWQPPIFWDRQFHQSVR